MVEIILVLLSLLVVIFGYTTFNLLRKNEKAEDILVSHQEFINKILCNKFELLKLWVTIYTQE